MNRAPLLYAFAALFLVQFMACSSPHGRPEEGSETVAPEGVDYEQDREDERRWPIRRGEAERDSSGGERKRRRISVRDQEHPEAKRHQHLSGGVEPQRLRADDPGI